MNYHLRLEPTFSHKDRSGCEGEAQLRSAEVAGGPVAEVALAGAGPGLAITVGLQRRHAAGPHGGEVCHKGERQSKNSVKILRITV